MATTVKHSRRRRFVTTMTAFLAISIMSVAFAAWVADGSGVGEATSTTHQAVSIDGVDTVADLFPGNTQNLDVTIDNSDNPYNVAVQSIAVAIDDDTCADDDTVPGNENPDFSFGSYTVADDALVVEAGGTQTVTLQNAITMGHASGDDCQGESWTVNLDFTGLSTGEEAANPSPLTAN